LLGGITLERTTSDNVSGTAQGFLTDHLGVNALNTANTFVGVFTGAPQSSLISYFARGQWNLSDRYLFTVTNRVDGSSKFGTGNQYGFFPSAAFAWRASNENFVKRLGMFDDLKFRVSDGVTGNQDIGNYASLATLGSTVYSLGGARAIGYGPNSPANPDLKWESTRQFDAGVDAAVLQSRVSVTADYYNKTTHDLLLYVPIPSTTGFTSQLQNVGSVRNKGFELAMNTVNLTGRFGWTSTLNLAWNRNKVLNLGPDTLIIGPAGVGAGANQNPTVLKVGEPINSFYGWVYNGMQNGAPTYKDLDGDGDITDADRTIIGNAQPNYTGGFSNRFTWGNFGLTAFLQWSVGNKIYNINRALLTAAAGNNNQLAEVSNAGTDGIPAPKIGNTFDSHPSTLFVENGTYLRGKNLRFDYSVPSRFLASGWLGSLNALQLYVSLQNFFTSTKYSGYDPEITEYAQSNLAQGFDFGTFPQARQVTIGFNAGF
jgi:TonB-linked SusC/RagA family outer membrane protein